MGFFDRFKKQPHNTLPDLTAHMSLEELLSKASVDPAYRPLFYQKLLVEQLYALGRPTESILPGDYVSDVLVPVGFHSLSSGHVALFTSEDRIFDGGVVKEQVPFLAMKGKALLEAIRGNAAILNPFSEVGKELTVEEIDGLLVEASKRAIQTVYIKQGAQKILDGAIDESGELLNALCSCFEKTSSVRAAFISLVQDTKSGQTRKVIGVQVDGKFPPVLQEIAKVLKVKVDPNEYVDVIKIGDRGSKAFFRRDQQPFYKRSY